MWLADKSFAYGKNLDSIQQYALAYPYLLEAVNSFPSEPTFRDELAYNQAVLAAVAFQQIQTSTQSAVASLSAQQKLQINIPTLNTTLGDLVQQAINNSNMVVAASPNATIFWKTRTRVFFQLATIEPNLILDALSAIQQAAQLAPTDAKIHYNLGVLLARVGQTEQAITALDETTKLKPNYRDAFYSLGLFYSQLGQPQKAKEQMEYILSKIGPDPEAQNWLEENKL